MDVKELLDRLPSAALSRRGEFKAAVKELRKLRSGQIEKLMTDLHHQVFEEVDCLACGNCCRVLGPRLIERDLQNLGKALRLSPSQVKSSYTSIDEDGDIVFNHMPCPFLGDDNFCFVYDNRPKACADYPHTDGRQVRGKLGQLLKNSEYCPAVYRMLELLPKAL